MIESANEKQDASVASFSFQLKDPSRILVVRPDRLGDVILSTPVFEVIKRHYPNAHLTVLTQEGVLPILKGLPHIDDFMTFEPQGRRAGVKGFIRLASEIRRRHFRVAIVLQSNWKIAAALFLAGIRYRLGPLSKLHSFFFYNRGIRQRRSQVEMHESDYNLQLLRKLGIRVGSRNVPTRIHISETTLERSKTWLLQRGWDPQKKMVAVHPGMGGSALNWPETHYYELIRRLASEGFQILITGGPTEGDLLDRFAQKLESIQNQVILYRTPSFGTVDFLGGLFNCAAMVIAPSTGPLHLAVALGKPVLTFYPPIRVQSALRWGPYLPDEARASVLVPEIYCGQDFHCLGNLCNYFPCMKSLTVKQAIQEVHKQLKPEGSGNGS